MILLAVVIGLSVLILVHELGHFTAAKFFGIRVDEFGIGFPPRLFGRKIGETIYSLNLLPFGGFVRIFGEDGSSENSEGASGESGSFSAQPVFRRLIVILAGVFMNVVLAWLIFSAVLFAGAPNHLIVAQVAADSPAAIAGLKEGDVILELKNAGSVFTDPVWSEDFVRLVEAVPAGVFDLKIMRGEEMLEFSLTGREKPPEGQGSLGVSLVDVGFAGTSLGRSFVEGLKTTVSTFGLVVVGFFDFFSRLFSQPEVLKTVAGPVGIFSLASKAGSLGLVYLFQFVAFISVNLAVLNLIPFPALDGGRALLLVIEKIMAKPVPGKVQIAINAFGFLLLLVLMILITVQDIGRLLN